MSDKEIEIPVLVSTPSRPDGTIGGIWQFRTLFGKAFGNIMKNPYVLAVIAFVITAKKAVIAWGVQDAAVNSLNQTLVRQGVYTKDLSVQYQAMAMDVAKVTAFADEDVIAAEAAVQPYLKGMKVSRELLMAIANFAVAQKMGLTQAAGLVGRTIGTSTNALMRQGVEFNSNLVGKERLAAVIDALNKKWSGQAEAQAQGLGAIPQAANALNNLLEVIGRALAPFVIIVAQQITVWARGVLESKKFTDLMTMAVQGLEITISFTKSVISAAINAVPEKFRTYLSGLRGVIEARTEKRVELYKKKMPRMNLISKKSQKERQKALDKYFKGKVIHHGNHWSSRKGIIKEEAKRREDSYKSILSNKDFEFINLNGSGFTAEQIATKRLKTTANYQIIIKKLEREKGRTERRRLEAEKKTIEEKTIEEARKDLASKDNQVQMLLDEEKKTMQMSALDQLSNLKNSKFGPQILIGKAASIAQIGISTAAAMSGAIVACAFIPPPVGEILGVAIASFLAIYGQEQINNIINSDIDNPGKVGEVPFTLESIIEMIVKNAGQAVEMVTKLVGAVFGIVGDAASLASKAIGDLAKEFGILGQIVAAPIQLGLDISAGVLNFAADISIKIGEIIGDIVGAIGEIVASIVGEILGAIGDVIGNIGDALFGWLFAEGGTVTHDLSGTPKITPLHKSGLSLGAKVNVTIRGGIVPSQRSAERLASIIAANL